MTTIIEHEAQQVKRERNRTATRRIRPRPLVAAEQLGPLGDGVRRGRLHHAHAWLA